MSENSALNLAVNASQPPITLPVPPPLTSVHEEEMPLPRKRVDRDAKPAVDAPQRWPRVFPSL